MLPLTGRRILVTRSRHQASELAVHLEGYGAIPILIPTIEVTPPVSYAPLDEGLSCLARYDWLVFTSVNAVDAFHRRCLVCGVTAGLDVPVAVIGAATGRAASKIGLNVALVPPQAVQESLADCLVSQVGRGSRLLVVLGAAARSYLVDTLRAAGAEVTVAEAYRTQIPDGSIGALREVFSEAGRYPDAITFTSSSTATNLLALLQAAELTLPPDVLRASIGPITTRTLCELNLPPHLESVEASIPALAKALADHFVG